MLLVLISAMLAGGATRIVQDQCGPFTDVTPGFCPYILELYYLGVTAGTSATTFSPDDPLTRGQGAVFVAKGLNQALARSSRRAALGQWWTTTPHWDLGLGVTLLGPNAVPLGLSSDGTDVWIANGGNQSVSRVRASDGRLLETWTGMPLVLSTMPALGRILVLTGGLDGGSIYVIDPSQPAGAGTLVADIGNGARSMAFDGNRIFVTNSGGIAHDIYLSIVTPGPSLPWSVERVRNPDHLFNGSLLFDGNSVWLASFAEELLRLDSAGGVAQVVPFPDTFLGQPTFDGANLWIPTDVGLNVVAAGTGTLVASLSGNGLGGGGSAAFDGERVLVAVAGQVSLWRAADLSPLGFSSTGDSFAGPVCSDGTGFWLTVRDHNWLVRF